MSVAVGTEIHSAFNGGRVRRKPDGDPVFRVYVLQSLPAELQHRLLSRHTGSIQAFRNPEYIVIMRISIRVACMFDTEHVSFHRKQLQFVRTVDCKYELCMQMRKQKGPVLADRYIVREQRPACIYRQSAVQSRNHVEIPSRLPFLKQYLKGNIYDILTYSNSIDSIPFYIIIQCLGKSYRPSVNHSFHSDFQSVGILLIDIEHARDIRFRRHIEIDCDILSGNIRGRILFRDREKECRTGRILQCDAVHRSVSRCPDLQIEPCHTPRKRYRMDIGPVIQNDLAGIEMCRRSCSGTDRMSQPFIL